MKVNTTTITAGEIETESYIIRGDELFYDRTTGSNNARGNVFMFSKKENIIITGESADNREESGIIQVYGNPLMKKVFEGDTLYLSADTLISIDDSLDTNKRVLAFRNVKFFRFDLQGKADSMSYFMADSLLYLYRDPVIWSEGNQIEADSINIVFENNQISRLNLADNSFMVLQDSLGNFNQLKGKNMIGYFQNNKIEQLDVMGNSESLFYALDEKDNSLTGINKTLCSNMRIRFKENRAQNISFYVDVDATFIPPHEIKEPDTRLKGFTWRESERPVLKEMLEGLVSKAPVPPEDSLPATGESEAIEQ
jgi:lipopolysaccharide export system protein LptA